MRNPDEMKLERTKNEILVRLPSWVDISELQNMLDYLAYKELTAKSEASRDDADLLVEEAKHSIWGKIKSSRDLK